ncbi:MAG: hypothetical protein AMJ59_26745 [Gammaproteobacteria bacterium SG8_31]|nr:MAG: hypothetical protein AMJ59_26745 [Gammaproteobacteria bacterium SG8_31]
MGPVAALVALPGLNAPVHAQQAGVAVGLDLAAPVAPLNAITVPDVNVLGILDGQGTPDAVGADQWPSTFGAELGIELPITQPNQRIALQQMGKALFWDMQVGGDGIQACATCHYHAGADNRITNQMSPGLKRTVGGPDIPAGNSDTEHDLFATANQTLAAADFESAADPTRGLPVDEVALEAAGWLADLADGTTGVAGDKPDPLLDVNDVSSSQGIRLGDFANVTKLEVCLDGAKDDGAGNAYSNVNVIDCEVEVYVCRDLGGAEIPCEVEQCLDAGGLETPCDGSGNPIVSGPTMVANPAIDTQGFETIRNPAIVDSFFTAGRDVGTLADADPGFDGVTETDLIGFEFDMDGTTVHTVRRVEPRNSPTAINAVYHMRNFWDGRADMFFNARNPLGFRDPNATVKISQVGTTHDDLRIRIPFSSLASQAVGPIESNFEMVLSGRPHRELGKKLLADDIMPLAGQAVSAGDDLLGGLTTGRGLTKSYGQFIEEIFNPVFWDGPDVCTVFDAGEGIDVEAPCTGGIDPTEKVYSLKAWNFSLFFGLAVQAYEATLFTEETIIDLLVGGIATGNVVNIQRDNRDRIRAQVDVPVAGLPLEGCIAAAALNNNAAQAAVATALCVQHYAQFIHPGAVAGSESDVATTNQVAQVPPGTNIGGCLTPGARSVTTTADNGVVQTPWCRGDNSLDDVTSVLLAIDRGVGRFFAGATGCAICHFNPEFTGITIQALTGFGAAPPPPLPPGQLRREALEVPMERMIAFNGAPAVYDAGFYNLGVRPTGEDISLGDAIGGVPLAFSKLAEQIQLVGTPDFDSANYDEDTITTIAADLGTNLFIPTSVADLSPRPWDLALACGPGLVGNGNGNANNNPNQQCAPNVIPGERLLRNGAFKAQGLRNAKFTGPYFHNGGKLNLRQVVEFYKTAGEMVNLNFNNLDAGLRIFNLGGIGDPDEAALVEMMETGLTDWRLAYEEDKFSHPEICVPHGHDTTTGKTILAGIPAVGADGNNEPLATFENIVDPSTIPAPIGTVAHHLNDDCTVLGLETDVAPGDGLSEIDIPPVATP